MKTLAIVSVAILVSSAAAARDRPNWWILRATPAECVNATSGQFGDLLPESVIRDFPGCFVVLGEFANSKVLLLDCNRTELATNFIYAPSREICNEAVTYLKKHPDLQPGHKS